jgi:ubiquinone/menaquinone biosynthesis C-methylase UbiE
MGLYRRFLLPVVLHAAARFRPFQPERPRAVAQVAGVVVEVGFGSGMNLPYYTGAVERVIGVDPLPGMVAKARERIAAAPFPVEVRGGPAEAIPLPDKIADSVVTTLTLCSVADPPQALREMARILKPGGRLHFLEHGYSPLEHIRRKQDRWNGLYVRFGGGCHLNRRIDELIEAAGFRFEVIERYRLKGAGLCYMFRGVAAPG